MTPTPLSTLLSFPFQDRSWFKKLLILALIILVSGAVPILPLILIAGYMARLARRVAKGEGAPTLPDWDDLGGIFKEGWRPFAAAFTWLLPVFALLFVGWLFTILPMTFLPGYQTGYRDNNIAPGEFFFTLSMVIGWGGMISAGLLSLLLGIFLPAGITHSAVKDEYAAAFRLKEWGPIFTANLGGFLLAYLVTFAISLVFALLMQVLVITILLCWAVPILAVAFSAYLYVVSAALFGEAYRVGVDKLALKKAAEPPAPLPKPAPRAFKAPAPAAVPASPVVPAEPAAAETLLTEAPAKAARKPRKAAAKPAGALPPDATLMEPPAVPAEAEPPTVSPSDATLIQPPVEPPSENPGGQG
jgi:hypothetical protein